MKSLNDWLRQIEQQPRDEAALTWLALADWLEERGDQRSELVRLLHQPNYMPTLEERNTRLRALLDVVPPLWENTLGMHFVWVPPGTFWMGGGGGKCGQNQVKIEQGFALGMFAVTQGQWQAVMGNNPSYFSMSGEGRDQDAMKDLSEEDLKQFPVENVSWDDVEEFLKKLNENERESGYLYRLTSEEEWEYACRGGSTSGDAMTMQECSYHFYFDEGPANYLSSLRANFNGNYPDGGVTSGPNLERTTRVGSYRPNRLGLYDMHGNVWEWTSTTPDAGSDRIYRGGSWLRDGRRCQGSLRGGDIPSFQFRDLGFRLACTPSEPRT